MQARLGNAEWEARTDYADVMRRRATGELPEMECSKAAARLLAPMMQPGDRVLDVGCGAGHYLRSLRRHLSVPFHYTGVDATARYVAAAREVWAGDAGACFQEDDIFELSFAEQSFQVVLCSNVLHNLAAIARPIGELLRVARRVVLMRLLVGDRSYRIQKVYSRPMWPFTSVDVADEFDENGHPVCFGFQNIYSRGYVTAVIERARPGVHVEFIEDRMFEAEAIERGAQAAKLPAMTRVVDDMQVFGNYIIQPWTFVLVTFGPAEVGAAPRGAPGAAARRGAGN